jgi:hypothetical protein
MTGTRRTIPRPALALLAVAAFAFSAPEARAIVVFDNFDPNGGFAPGFFAGGARAECADGISLRTAVQFTVGGSDVLLSSITLPIGLERFLTTDHKLRVRITSDDAGHPGATIEVLSENQNIWPPSTNVTATTLFSVAHPLLQGGASYWIVTEPSSALPNCPDYLAYQWHTNLTGTTVPYMEDVEAGVGVPMDPWTNTPIPVNTAFRVEGDEPVDAGGAVDSAADLLGSIGPMPFSQSTTLEFALRVAGPVSLVIYDLAGKHVRTLVSGTLGAGRARRLWDGRNENGHAVPSGLYFARLRTQGFDQTHKLLLIR